MVTEKKLKEEEKSKKQVKMRKISRTISGNKFVN